VSLDEGLLEWARLPGPRKVLAAARRRLEAGGDLSGSSLRVSLTPDERVEVGRLLGMTWVGSGKAVGARTLAGTLQDLGTDVAELLVATGAPLRDLRAERDATRKGAAAERESATLTLIGAGVPADAAAAWVGRRGLPAAGSGQLADLASRCARVWELLPGPGAGRKLLTVLAASALDDPHALDRGSPVATGVLRLLGHELPASAETWRATWEEHGIDCDPVSSRVLVLNLLLAGDAACVPLSRAAGPEPLWLTLRSLNGAFQADARDVYVCENPSVLIAAADVLGPRARPLICTNGRPSAAAVRLLTRLAAAGASLHVRADDDSAGQEIVKSLRTSIPSAQLWRYYLRPPATPRYEEQDLDALLRDLDRNQPLEETAREHRSSCRGVDHELRASFPVGVSQLVPVFPDLAEKFRKARACGCPLGTARIDVSCAPAAVRASSACRHDRTVGDLQQVLHSQPARRWGEILHLVPLPGREPTEQTRPLNNYDPLPDFGGKGSGKMVAFAHWQVT
jgi:uncharacterized protein (TIGR02679 family)